MNTAMRMIDAARADGLLVVGHTLLWHSQIPLWQSNLRSASNTTTKNIALQWMKEYITYIATFYKGKIHTWDVLNEVFPDGLNSNANWRNVMRNSPIDGNPWYIKIGADFVYEGYKAARLADPNAILYYNDYNMNDEGKSTMVRNMVRDINNEWKKDPYYNDPLNLDKSGKPRHLIEGIGLQSHHNTGVSPESVRNSINLFRPLEVKLSISELDVLSQNWSDYSPNRNTPTNSQKLASANLFGQYFDIYLENADIIERVTMWGVYDEQSWRRTGLPLLFEGNPDSMAKPAYYKIIEALENSP